MQLLAGIPLTGHRILLPTGLDHAGAHALLTSLLRNAEGPQVAGLFGEPRKSADRIDYFCGDGRVSRYEDLDQVGRDRLRAEIGRLISVARRAAEKEAAVDPAKAQWPALVAAAIELPSFEYVYAHEGRPVLTAWGMAPASAPGGLGLISVLDDGLANAPVRGFPYVAAGAALLSLLAVGALAAFLTPMALGLLAQPAPVCKIGDADQRILTEVDREKKREQELRQRLASLNQSIGQRRQSCPIPVIQTPPPPPRIAERPPAPPPPPEPPRAQPEPPRPAPPPQVQPRPTPPPTPPQRAEPPRPVQRPPDAQPCNTETRSGGAGITTTKHFLGDKPGRVRLNYNTATEPDRIIVYHQGRRIAGTDDRPPGFVSGRGYMEFNWNPPPGASPNSYTVTVEVTGTPGSPTTVWQYVVACP